MDPQSLFYAGAVELADSLCGVHTLELLGQHGVRVRVDHSNDGSGRCFVRVRRYPAVSDKVGGQVRAQTW